jgi:hypothetical protein
MRFRLRTLLIMIGIGCLALGFAADQGYRQQQAVDAINARGGRVDYRAGASWSRPWQKWLGRDFFEPVSMVFWAGAPIVDDDLVCLRALPRLQTLTLTSTSITDAGLQHLEGLREAMLIDLRFTQVTGQGANRLRDKLPNAKILLLSDVD